MNGIDAIMAHDATCDSGDEWMLHGMAEYKEDPKGGFDPTAKDGAKDSKIGCVVFCIVLLSGMGFGIYHLITTLL